MFFLSPEINCFFSEISNNLMRALGRKKHMFFLVMRGLNLMRARSKTEKKNIVALPVPQPHLPIRTGCQRFFSWLVQHSFSRIRRRFLPVRMFLTRPYIPDPCYTLLPYVPSPQRIPLYVRLTNKYKLTK